MRCDAGAGVLSWWRCQSPVAQSCGLVNHLNSFRRGMFKLSAKSDADSQSFWMQWPHSTHAPSMASTAPPLTSTVKLSLFTHAHSSPLSLAARLHRCCTNCSRYINNGWTFSGDLIYHLINLFFTHLSICLLIHQIFINCLQLARHQRYNSMQNSKMRLKKNPTIPKLTELMF